MAGLVDRRIVISSAPDSFDITVKEPQKNGTPGASWKFAVSRSRLVEKSAYFRRCLSFNVTNGHGAPNLQDDNILSMHIWLLCMHDVAYADWPGSVKTRIDIETIWHVVNAADKYLFEDELAKAGQNFFKQWYSDNVPRWSEGSDLVLAKSLAFPCHFFDHAEAFAEVTKWLAYNCPGHITENRPFAIKFKHMHLCPPDFVGEYP